MLRSSLRTLLFLIILFLNLFIGVDANFTNTGCEFCPSLPTFLGRACSTVFGCEGHASRAPQRPACITPSHKGSIVEVSYSPDCDDTTCYDSPYTWLDHEISSSYLFLCGSNGESDQWPFSAQLHERSLSFMNNSKGHVTVSFHGPAPDYWFHDNTTAILIQEIGGSRVTTWNTTLSDSLTIKF